MHASKKTGFQKKSPVTPRFRDKQVLCFNAHMSNIFLLLYADGIVFEKQLYCKRNPFTKWKAITDYYPPIQVLPLYLYSRKWYASYIYADVLHPFEDNTTNGDCYLWVQMGLKRPGWPSRPFPLCRPPHTQRLFLSYNCSCVDMVLGWDSASETRGHPGAQKTTPSCPPLLL